MSKFKRAEDAIDYYDAPTYYCAEPGCDWSQESEWNVGAMSAAKQAGIDHWNAVHKPGVLPAASDGFLPWSGTILVEGRPSVDGRLLSHMSVAWESSPDYRWPLLKVGGLLVGQIERVWRESIPGGWVIRASGTIEDYGPGTSIPVGADLAQCDWDASTAGTLLLRKGYVSAVTVGVEPAWPETMLLVGAFPRGTDAPMSRSNSSPHQRP